MNMNMNMNINKSKINMMGKLIISTAIFLCLCGASSFAYGSSTVLYIEKLASKELLQSYSSAKPLTKVQAGELLVHIYAKSNKTSVDLIPGYDRLSDTNNIYACKSSNLYLLPPEEGNFKPNGIITKDAFINGLRLATKGNSGFNNFLRQKSSSVKIGDYKRISKDNRSFANDLVRAGIIKTDKNKNLNPKGSFTQGEALKIVYTVGLNLGNKSNNSNYLKANGYNFQKLSKKNLSGYMVPKSSEVSYMKGFNGTLAIFFPGIIESKSGKSIWDIHYQICETVASGKVFKDSDIILFLDYISNHFDFASSTYKFENTVYIKSGKLLKSKPSAPYIQLQKGNVLNITLSKGKAK